MERRRYLTLAGAAATGGCLRLSEDESAEGQTTLQTPGEAGEIEGTWPQYGYDAANSGATTDEQGPTGDVTGQWRATSGRPVSVDSAPAVADGRAYFVSTGNDEEPSAVWAVDASTGAVEWQQPIDGSYDQSVVVADGQVFLGTNRGRVVSLDGTTGSYNWRTSIENGVTPWNWPAVTDEVVHVTDETGSLYALSTADGSEIGRIDLGGRCLSGPAFADGQVFVTTFGPTDEAAYPDGTEPFQFFGGYLDDEPVASLVDMDGSGTVHAVSPSEGGLQWEVDLPDFVVATPTVVDGTVYVGCWDGYLYALDAADGSREWRHDLGTPISGSASVADGTVYVGGWDSVLYAIDTDGNEEWVLPVDRGDKITSKPAVADGVVYANADDGGLVAADADGTRLWRFGGPEGDFNQSAPAVADGALFVCGDTGTETVDGEQRDVGGLFMIA